jgi:hypothetical protein
MCAQGYGEVVPWYGPTVHEWVGKGEGRGASHVRVSPHDACSCLKQHTLRH